MTIHERLWLGVMVSLLAGCPTSDRRADELGGKVEPTSLCFCCDPEGAFPQAAGSFTISDIGSPDPEADQLSFGVVLGDDYTATPTDGLVPVDGSSTVAIAANTCGTGGVTVELGRGGISDSSSTGIAIEGKTCDEGFTCNDDCECVEDNPPTCSPSNPLLARAFAVAILLGATFDSCVLLSILEIIHSAIAVGSKAVANDHTTIVALRAMSTLLTTAVLNQLFLQSDFDCGAGENGYTICPTTPANNMVEGDYLMVFEVLEEDVPLNDDTNTYQYGFVFDADGNTSNNYEPSAQYANDFFQDTDLWYEANYTPAGGWKLKATDASGGGFTTIPTDARVIISENVMVLVVPASEFSVASPNYRVTAFRHTGDFGIPSPHDYDGSIWPAVADGLEGFPTADE